MMAKGITLNDATWIIICVLQCRHIINILCLEVYIVSQNILSSFTKPIPYQDGTIIIIETQKTYLKCVKNVPIYL
jgi:hypothetical protein